MPPFSRHAANQEITVGVAVSLKKNTGWLKLVPGQCSPVPHPVLDRGWSFTCSQHHQPSATVPVLVGHLGHLNITSGGGGHQRGSPQASTHGGTSYTLQTRVRQRSDSGPRNEGRLKQWSGKQPSQLRVVVVYRHMTIKARLTEAKPP